MVVSMEVVRSEFKYSCRILRIPFFISLPQSTELTAPSSDGAIRRTKWLARIRLTNDGARCPEKFKLYIHNQLYNCRCLSIVFESLHLTREVGLRSKLGGREKPRLQLFKLNCINSDWKSIWLIWFWKQMWRCEDGCKYGSSS